jgi:excisionase family DNA binding protein
MNHPDPSDAAAIPPLLTYSQVADALHVSTRTVQTLVKSGKLPAVRFGQTVRIDPADLRRFIDDAKREGDAA